VVFQGGGELGGLHGWITCPHAHADVGMAPRIIIGG
jgi:hypothetical protein